MIVNAVFNTARARRGTYVMGGYKKDVFDTLLKLYWECLFYRQVILKKWRNEDRDKIGGCTEENEKFNTLGLQIEYLKDNFLVFRNYLKECPSQHFYKGRHHNDAGFCLVDERDYEDYA